mmetsp:Transcript_67324/g.181011  ORF Transcript_67324/g.181011 Transcript_67324/m.181011 type:complete len:310 (-) Transcript_67324:60-989(-)
MELCVPTGLYGMAIAEPAALDRRLDGNFMFFVENARTFSLLCLHYFVTSLFLVQVWRMGREREIAECSGHLLLLEFGCVFLFEVRMLVDIKKSFGIMSLLWAAPYPKPTNASGSVGSLSGKTYFSMRNGLPQHGAVFEAETAADGGGMLTQMFRKVRRGKDSAAHWKMDGISRCYRVWCLLTVGLPSLLLNVVLGYLGGVYIMRSPNDSDMVMNTLAVVFVAEVEEILYVAFTSDAMRYNLEHMRTVEVHLSNRHRIMGWFMSSIVNPLLTFSAAACLVVRTRQADCPDFVLSWKTFANIAILQDHDDS